MAIRYGLLADDITCSHFVWVANVHKKCGPYMNAICSGASAEPRTCTESFGGASPGEAWLCSLRKLLHCALEPVLGRPVHIACCDKHIYPFCQHVISNNDRHYDMKADSACCVSAGLYTRQMLGRRTAPALRGTLAVRSERRPLFAFSVY